MQISDSSSSGDEHRIYPRMRYSREQREKTYDSLLQAASVLVRRDGPERVSVAELMKSVGLTHGGFYYHFESRESMVARAMERAFMTAQQRLEALCERLGPFEALREYIEGYLSPSHRDNRGLSCPIATLSAYQPSFDEEGRQTFEQGAAGLTSVVARMLAKAGHAESGSLAVSVVAEMAGALSLSRVITDRARSDAVLRICRDSVLARVALPGNRQTRPSSSEGEQRPASGA